MLKIRVALILGLIIFTICGCQSYQPSTIVNNRIENSSLGWHGVSMEVPEELVYQDPQHNPEVNIALQLHAKRGRDYGLHHFEGHYFSNERAHIFVGLAAQSFSTQFNKIPDDILEHLAIKEAYQFQHILLSEDKLITIKEPYRLALSGLKGFNCGTHRHKNDEEVQLMATGYLFYGELNERIFLAGYVKEEDLPYVNKLLLKIASSLKF